MIQYLKHAPILLTFEQECTNLLCRGNTYQLEAVHGKRLERLLRAGKIDGDAATSDQDLIDFMLGERLLSLQGVPAESQLLVKDFRSADSFDTWLWARTLCFGFIMLVGMIVFITLPASYPDFVYVQTQTPWLSGMLLLPILLHETVHYVSGRCFGLSGRPGIGLRGWLFIVATVTFPNLYELPKHQRWVPILAPMVLDCTMYGVLWPFREMPLIAFFHFFYGVAIFWQFLIFLRTDIYLFIATMFNQPNLNRLAWTRSSAEEGHLSMVEKKATAMYWGFFVVSLFIVARIGWIMIE